MLVSKSNNNLTLKEILHPKPTINTINDIIINNTQSILKENIFNQIEIKNNSQSFLKENINNPIVIDNLNTKSITNPTNTDITTSTESKELDNNLTSSNYSTDLIITSEETSEEEIILSDTKLYWEYGNTGLKINNFKQKMSNNLSIMNNIDKLFNEYIDTILANDYSKLFNQNSNIKFKLKSGVIKSIKGQVEASLNYKNIIKTYNVIEAGFITISDLNISEKDLKLNSIPNLNSVLTHKDNILHIIKIVNLLKLNNKMKLQSNLSNKNLSLENIYQNANSYIDKLIKKNKKKYILKSDKNTGIYIKVYNDYSKAFYINQSNNIIYYLTTNINFVSLSLNVRFYSFNIKKGKIIKI